MPSISSLIPVRSNGDDILSGWFNTIRTTLITLFGTESLTQTSFAGLASQTNTDVTDLIFDKAKTRRVELQYVIVTATKVESGTYIFLYDGTNWATYGDSVQGVNSLVTLDIDSSTGQVDYTSDTETFTLDYIANTFNI